MESIGIIGAGQMGQGIAQICLQAGFKVAIYDQDMSKLESIRNSLEKPLSKFCKSNNSNLDKILENLNTNIVSLESFPCCDLIIEAATENVHIKSQIFEKLPHFHNTIFATNTSSLRIEGLSKFTKFSENFIGLHFMNPVPYMQLIEIIPHTNTSQDTLSKMESFAGYLNKTYIISSDSPGFVVNRILLPMINEAIKTLEQQVASVSDIDLAMRLGSNHPMGPLELADFIGLDTCAAILNVLHQELKDPHYAPCPLLIDYVKKGLLGRKTKQGFYTYD